MFFCWMPDDEKRKKKPQNQTKPKPAMNGCIYTLLSSYMSPNFVSIREES